MLIESVLSTLIDRSILSREDVIDTIGSVIETKQAMAGDNQDAEVERKAAGLLVKLTNSLRATSVSARAT